MKTCIFCSQNSDMIGLEGLKDHEEYCPFCNKTQKEFIIMNESLKNKTCLECFNLKQKQIKGMVRVRCSFNKVKENSVSNIEELFNNKIYSIIYNISAFKCKNFELDI